MPRLFEKVDGTFVIRTYAGDEDAGTFGTWQIHPGGFDVLRRARIFHDGDDVPMPLFRELRGRRLIWNETGYMGCRWPDEENSHVGHQPPSTPPSLPAIRPRLRFIAEAGLAWHIAANFAFLNEPDFATVIQQLCALIAGATQPVLSIGATHVSLAGKDPRDPFRNLLLPVTPQAEPYGVLLRSRGGNARRIGEMPGLSPQGTFFSCYGGRRIAEIEALEWGEVYYLVIQTLHTYDNPVLQANPPLRLALRAPWVAFCVRLPDEPSPHIQQYLRAAGHRAGARAAVLR